MTARRGAPCIAAFVVFGLSACPAPRRDEASSLADLAATAGAQVDPSGHDNTAGSPASFRSRDRHLEDID